MKLNNKTMQLICKLEHILGSECYNPSSYDGNTGETGCSFRYPVWAKINSNELESKCKYELSDVKSNNISSIRYHFGANQLFVGLGLYGMLEFLEKRYNIDFNKLETQYLADNTKSK